jgi:mannose-6-phosphate isomerase-like protein (cupin superfamily)
MKQKLLDSIPYLAGKTPGLREPFHVWALGRLSPSQRFDIEGLEVGTYKPHIHDRNATKLLVVSGRGVVVLDGVSVPYKRGDVIDIPVGVSHGFEVEKLTVFFSITDDSGHGNGLGMFDFRYADDPVA